MKWGTSPLLCVTLMELPICAPLAVAAQSTTVIIPVAGTVNGETFEEALTLTETTVSIAGNWLSVEHSRGPSLRSPRRSQAW